MSDVAGPERGPVAGAPGAVVGAPGRPRSRTRWVFAARTAAVSVVMVLAVQLVAAGYEYGFGEQVLLSIKGIGWADPTAFVNDWFNENAPQPHILFDLVTYVGERTGLRPQIYFLYWLTSVVVAAAAVVLLADTWFPRRARPFELLAGALLVTGPYFALGTFLVVHREAVPNALGGALGFLTAALLIARKDRAAVICAAATTLVHVQHGTVAAGLLLTAWVLDRDRLRDRVVRWYPVAVVGILAVVYLVGVARGLVAGTADVSAICETASPGHCYPDSWAPAVIRDGLMVLVLGLAAPLLARRRPRLGALGLLAAPALVVVVALVTDLLDVQPFESIGRQLFLYRFVMVVAPFAPIGIVLALTRPLDRTRSWTAWAVSLVGVGLFVYWHTMTFANLVRFRPTMTSARWATLLTALAVVVGIALWAVVVRPRPGAARARLDLPAAAVIAVAAVAVLIAFGGRATGFVPLRIDYRPDEGAVALGHSIEEATPPGSVIAARPDLGWLRLMSRRAVLIDCKGVPYGGQPWQEYNERLRAVGVPTPLACQNTGFAALTAQDIVDLGTEFGATHVLLEPTDTAFAQVEESWPRLTGEGQQMSLFEIPRTTSGSH